MDTGAFNQGMLAVVEAKLGMCNDALTIINNTVLLHSDVRYRDLARKVGFPPASL